MKSLEIFIGLFFVYLVLSTLVTSVSEIIAARFHFKARVLRQTVRRLFADNHDLEDAFFKHPEIQSLIDPKRGKRSKYFRWLKCNATKDTIAPSYLDSEIFTRVAFSVLAGEKPMANSISSFESFLSKWVDQSDLGNKSQRERFANTLGVHIRSAESSILENPQLSERQALKQEIERWYDTGMERSRGIYKRKIQHVVIYTSIAIAVLLNADTIRIVQALSNNEAVLASTVDAALIQISEQSSTSESDLPEKNFQTATRLLEDSAYKLENVGIPLGWDSYELEQLRQPSKPLWFALLGGVFYFFMKAVGLGATAIAASLGAPFWYDILNKLAKIRTSAVPSGTDPGTSASGADGKPSTRKALEGVNPQSSPKSLNRAFADQNESFSIDRAYWLGSCAKSAYLSFSGIEQLLPSWGFRNVTPFGDDQTNTTFGTQGFMATSNDCIVIAFRGTEPSELQDILTDADLRQTPWELTTGQASLSVHKGFLKAYQSVQMDIAELLEKAMQENPDKSIWLTGHSLGAALATLCAADLCARKVPISGLYTFGSPRVGNKGFIAYINQEFSEQIFRFVNEDDPVTEVPHEAFWDYTHIGQLRYLDRFNRIKADRSTWKRVLRKTAFWIDHSNPEASKDEAIASIKAEFKKRGGYHSMDVYIEKISNLSGHKSAMQLSDASRVLNFRRIAQS